MDYRIEEIDYTKTIPIRHTVMWPDKPLAYVKLSLDPYGTHYGLFLANSLISVISLFKSSNQIQFRKFATLREYQGKGYGSILLTFIIDVAKKDGVDNIWCNARVEKMDFYKKFGLQPTQKRFYKGGIEYRVMERKFPKDT